MKKEKIAYFAGGCFWCTEAVFQRLQGVLSITSGYIGGDIKNPAYREVCTGRTGHAEGIKVIFDEDVIAYKELLYVFFATHDPTTLNRQGNDLGTQYRSALYCVNEDQKDMAETVIKELQSSVFDKTVVTEINMEMPFYQAEEEHQNYYNQHSEQPYCSVIISPKIQTLKARYAHLINLNDE